MTEDVRKRAWYDAAIRVALLASCYCEGLARACLTVCKDGAIVALEARLDHVLHALAEDCLLLGHHVEDATKLELKVVLLDFIVAQPVLREVEFYLALLGRQCCQSYRIVFAYSVLDKASWSAALLRRPQCLSFPFF